MTKSEIEQTYGVKCERMRNPYSEDCEFWAFRDDVTNEELGRGATLTDVHQTLNVIKNNGV